MVRRPTYGPTILPTTPCETILQRTHNSQTPRVRKWDRKIQRYYAVATIADGVSFILFFGLTDYLPSAETPIFGLLFVSSLGAVLYPCTDRAEAKKEFPKLLEER